MCALKREDGGAHSRRSGELGSVKKGARAKGEELKREEARDERGCEREWQRRELGERARREEEKEKEDEEEEVGIKDSPRKHSECDTRSVLSSVQQQHIKGVQGSRRGGGVPISTPAQPTLAPLEMARRGKAFCLLLCLISHSPR